MMMKQPAILFLSLAAIAAAPSVSLAQEATQQSYDLEAFDKIHAAHGVVVTLNMGENQQVTASNRDGNFDRLKVVVKDRELIIRRRMKGAINNHDYFKLNITASDLKGLKVTTGAELSGKNVEIGATDIKVDTGAIVKLSGACDAISVYVATGGVLSAKKLACQHVEAKARTGGIAKLYASDTAIAKARLGGAIWLYGNPRSVSKGTSIGGDVRVKK